jgi:Tol biopolymer transport system component
MKQNTFAQLCIILLTALRLAACTPTDISWNVPLVSTASQSLTPTWTPPLPTHPATFMSTATPAIPEISGYIVYMDIAYPDAYQVFKENLYTREIIQLTSEGQNGEPSWSPDGKHIVFSSNRDGETGIYTMKADGSAQQPLTQCLGSASMPAWSPDGSKVIFVGECEEIDDDAVYVVDVESHELTRLTHDSGNYLHPSWSSKGDRIAFVFEDKNYIAYIFIMNADGSEIEELTTNASRPVWCPDDTCIIYQAGYGHGYTGKLMIVNLETKETTPLLPASYAAPENVSEFLSSRSPIRGYFTYSISGMLYAIDIKTSSVYSLGLQALGGSLYP